MRPLIALDGEGFERAPGRPQAYGLLTAYDAHRDTVRTLEAASLGTREVFAFLTALPAKSLKVMYGSTYDVNMWLADMPRHLVEQLWRDGWTYWDTFHIEWNPGKSFTVRDLTGPRCTVWDIFGFFQCSFVEALRAWNIPTDTDVIATMKADRGTFTEADMVYVRAYCEAECRALAQLTTRLIETCTDVGVTLHRYDGAGAIASSFMRQHDTRSGARHVPDDVGASALAGYYGGRVEVSQVGELGDLFTYDISSAYPAATADLPCLSHGAWWRTGKRTDEALAQYPTYPALCYCWWNTMASWPPLPWRKPTGGILYPQNGYGWHWRSEVEAARRYLGADAVEVTDGFMFERRCEHVPFAFLRDTYARRKAYEDRGDAAGHVLKIGMAAISGKLSQSESRRSRRRSPWQHFALAGMITAATRARILDAIATNPDAVVSVSTDGIASHEKLDVEVEARFGGWKAGVLRDVFMVAPGIYCWTGADGAQHVRTRGFHWRELDFSALRAHWARTHGALPYAWNATRFIGVGAARVTDWKLWRTWAPVEKRLGFFPSVRFPQLTADGRILDCVPPRFSLPGESTAYDPVGANDWIDDGHNDTAMDMLAELDDGRL